MQAFLRPKVLKDLPRKSAGLPGISYPCGGDFYFELHIEDGLRLSPRCQRWPSARGTWFGVTEVTPEPQEIWEHRRLGTEDRAVQGN